MSRHATCAVLAALSLAACGGAPSDDDVRSALRAQVEAFAGKQSGDFVKAQFEGVKVLNCKSADAGGQRCDWTGPMGGGSGRFVKKDGAWHLVGA